MPCSGLSSTAVRLPASGAYTKSWPIPCCSSKAYLIPCSNFPGVVNILSPASALANAIIRLRGGPVPSVREGFRRTFSVRFNEWARSKTTLVFSIPEARLGRIYSCMRILKKTHYSVSYYLFQITLYPSTQTYIVLADPAAIKASPFSRHLKLFCSPTIFSFLRK